MTVGVARQREKGTHKWRIRRPAKEVFVVVLAAVLAELGSDFPNERREDWGFNFQFLSIKGLGLIF